MTGLLLDGVRVLDLSTMIAAPTTATILGDYGADVVKVEMPGTGDFVRRFGRQKDGQGIYWKALSRGKRSVVATAAFARELLGFVWSIGQRVPLGA